MKNNAFTVTARPSTSSTWYLAEGSTAMGVHDVDNDHEP